MILISIDPETNTSAALIVSASSAKIQGNEVHLDNGAVVRDGVLFDSAGKRAKAERPRQVFTRWYGFALTFPGCEISGG